MPTFDTPLTKRALVILAVKKTDRIKAIERHLVCHWGLTDREAERHAKQIFSSIEAILDQGELSVAT